MFWRFGFHAASSIDTLLDKDDQSLLTLDNLLDEDDLLQECKSQNTRLVDYFQRVDVLGRLLGWVSGEVGAAKFDDEEELLLRGSEMGNKTNRFKYPYIATEVLCSEIWSIVETCVSTHPDKLLVPFWNAVLDKLPEDLRFSTEKNNTHAAAHFAKVNAVFLGKKPGEMLKFIQHQPSVLGRILRHIENPSFVDLLVRIIQLDEYTYGYDGAVGVLEWLSSERLIPRLIDMLSPAYPPDIHQVVSDLIKGIISMATPSPGAGLASNGPAASNTAMSDGGGSGVSSNQFARELAREDSVSKLVAYMLQDFSTSLSESESTLSPDSVRATHFESASSSSIHAMGVLTELIRKNNSDYFEPYLFHTLRNRLIGVQQAMIQQGEGHNGETDGRGTLERAMREMVDRMGVVNLGFVLTILCDDRRLDRLVSYLRRPRSLLAESGTVVPANIPASALTFERFRITELLAELLHCSNMALLNRPLRYVRFVLLNRYQHLYDAEGRLQGGLGGLEELARVISLGNEDEDGDVHRFDGNDDMDTEIEPALELPISSASSTSNASSLLDSDEDEDMSTSSEDDSMDMEEIAMYDEPQMQSTAEPPPISPEVDMHAAEPTESNSVSPSVSADNIGPLRHGSVSSLPTRRNSRRSTLPSASAPSAEAPLVVGERLKKRFLELNVLGVLLDLFFEFPWNNFLHNAVYDILHQILTGQVDTSSHYREDIEKPSTQTDEHDSERRSEGSRGYNRELILSLFRDAQLMHKIVEGQRRNDEESAKPRTPRLGYMGHLTLISEDVLTALDRYPASLRDEIMQYAPKGLDTEHGKGSWDEYVTGRYRETKVRDTRLLGGGKPAVGLSGINSGGRMGDVATKWKVDEEEMGGIQATVGAASSPTLDNKPINNEMRGEFRRSVSSKPRREGSADFGVAPTTLDDDDDDFVAGHSLKRFDNDEDDDGDDEEGWLSQSSTFSAMSERRPLGVNGFDDVFDPQVRKETTKEGLKDPFADDDFGPFTAPTASSSSIPSNSDDPFPSFSSSFTDEMALEGMDNLDDSAFDDNFGDFGDFGEFQTGGTASNSSEPPSLNHPTVDVKGDGEESFDGELTPTAGSWISDLSASEGSLGSISSSIDSISSPEGVNVGLDLTGTGVEASESTEQSAREAKH
ncbi:SIT4 phosphatase-associated protein-domain-containing protein [Lentinula lateritia]|uniref:SIT4 phosphatase-associated protein-domain-containing protein n=1 Tax=Lentinula lateritia TaxID=40482 RepID=A0ABQ8VWV8_9AGAR|nr:SIT4 phosphatase-associated protein-domain-containing protein [Lentinula lateritia]